VRGEFADARLCGEFLDDVPYGPLRYALAPSSTRATHTPEKPRFNSDSFCPSVNQAIHPIRNRNGSDVTGLSAQVHDGPMPFALLQVAESELCDLMAPESSGQQQGK
jgi:hypothetical protein